MRTPSTLLLLTTLLLASCSQTGNNAATTANTGDSTEVPYVDTLALNHPEYLPTIPLDTIAPDICAPDTVGNVISLSDFAGRYVVVDFWASWCGDCRREAPIFADVYAEWNSRQINGADIQFLSYSFDRDADRWKQYLREAAYPWPQISTLQPKWHDIPVTQAYGLHWIPAFLLISPDGHVVAKAITAEGIREEMRKTLGTLPPPSL